MSKRHWLRDEIDFSEEPLGDGPHETCADECVICNAAAQEIADSLALYELPCEVGCAADYVATSRNLLDLCAEIECGIY